MKPLVINQHTLFAEADPELNRKLILEASSFAPLVDRFGVPPFSVLHADAEYWQKRKRQWIDLGIRSEEGRGSEIAELSGSNAYAVRQEQINGMMDKYGKQKKPKTENICSPKWNRTGADVKTFGSGAPGDLGAEFKAKARDGVPGRVTSMTNIDGYREKESGEISEKQCWESQTKEKGIAGTSIFDPVLCEAMYQWFCPPNGSILDPFAGGSVRGVVAGFFGHPYTGIDIRAGQVAANEEQGLTIGAAHPNLKMPKWIVGDSTNLEQVLENEYPFEDLPQYDMIFTCPPYYNLEVYSTKEGDGSAYETYEKFIAWYQQIFAQAAARLKPNRFAVVVVGEVREDGWYVDFERDNISVFRALGFKHYNRIVFETVKGSLPVRIGAQFAKYRKVGNSHQMVYVFYKGDDWKLIPQTHGILEAYNV